MPILSVEMTFVAAADVTIMHDTLFFQHQQTYISWCMWLIHILDIWSFFQFIWWKELRQQMKYDCKFSFLKQILNVINKYLKAIIAPQATLQNEPFSFFLMHQRSVRAFWASHLKAVIFNYNYQPVLTHFQVSVLTRWLRSDGQSIWEVLTLLRFFTFCHVTGLIHLKLPHKVKKVSLKLIKNKNKNITCTYVFTAFAMILKIELRRICFPLISNQMFLQL